MPVPPPPSPVPAVISVDSVLAALTVRQKAAQLVMPWISGAYAAVDDSDFQVMTRWVDSLQVGGVLVSVGSPFDIAVKLNALQQRSQLPLLVSADLEWGAGMRLTGGTSFPMLMAVGATRDARDAYAIGAAAATEGRAVGIHVNFAPDADLNNNPLNPIINVRSFGEEPVAVGKLVQAYVRGLQQHGMLATLKHFPGHGDTRVDSHLTLPVITANFSQLDAAELIPFRAGIAAGAAIVMSGHIAFPSFTGSDEPATMSPAVMTGMLRDSLGFTGLVVTDALSMGAIANQYGAGEASVRAFIAGSDLLVMPSDPDVAVNAMAAAVASGRIALDRLDASVRRVLEIKRELGLFASRTVPLDALTSIVGTRQFQDKADDLAIRSLTLVRDISGPLHAIQGRRTRLALIAYADERNSSVGQRIAEVLRSGGNSVDYFRLWPMSGPQSYDSARAIIARDERVVFVAQVRPITSRGTIALPDSLAHLIMATDALQPTVLVSLGSPYLLDQVPTVKSYLLAWSAVRAAERAVGMALLGQVPIEGRLPIRLPPYALGHGVVVPAARPRASLPR